MILPIELLKTFLAAADSGRFTSAAAAVHRTQSAVSMQMKRLEQEIGRPVFARNGKRLVLTSAGEELLGHARRIVQSHDHAVTALSGPALCGTIRFGAAEDYASMVLPRVLSRFARSYPEIRVDVLVTTSVDVKERLDAGELDVALCTEVVGRGQVVHREPVVWAASARHGVHEQDPLPLAVYHEGCAFRAWAIRALRREGRPYRIAYVSTSLTGIIAAVESGLAVAPIGASYTSDRMRVLGPESGFPVLPSARIALHRSSAADSEPADCFVRHVAASFRDLRIPGGRDTA
ncbi:MAG: LysR substrate-binding domain-containing protein [Desulfobacteraceae bacterium]|jgi:DNA-binding transcriptional LysR family regulator